MGKHIATAWQIEKGEFGIRNRLITEWVPLCMKNAMSFYSLLVTSELSLQSCSGRHPW
jgi:hypothetical protein